MSDSEHEEWRPIPGHPLYDVSNLGRVRSWMPHPRSPLARSVRPKILKPWMSGTSRHLSIRLGPDYQTVGVHRLVAWAFIGPPPPGRPVVRHLDDHPQNNTPDNLAYGTQVDNGRDAVRNNRHPWASQTQCWAGHPYTPESTYVTPTGARRCRVCQRAHNQAYKARLRAQREAVA